MSQDRPKCVRFINGNLRCLQGWCQILWAVRDLNPLRKTVPWSACGSETDIRYAIKNAQEGDE
jgi:hypothetical protein